AYRMHWIAAPDEARRRANDPAYAADKDATNIWGWIDVRDAARAFRLGLEADVAGFAAVNITAADTLRREPTEELLRSLLPAVEIRRPLPGTAAGWCGARARDLLGFVPRHSWRDDDA
ncbi:MAG TPA: hypothetical protein VFI22_15615, partial [Thermomicrobiales bacterium]|nr:hypothetical protein [Thermomicrobiales bacterium]